MVATSFRVLVCMQIPGQYLQKLGWVTSAAHHVFADNFTARQFRFFLSGFLAFLQVCSVLSPTKVLLRDVISLQLGGHPSRVSRVHRSLLCTRVESQQCLKPD